MQNQALLNSEEVATLAEKLYEELIRKAVEQQENIGKMVIIDVQTGDYGVDETGLKSSRRLREKNPNGQLFGIRVGGMMEQI